MHLAYTTSWMRLITLDLEILLVDLSLLVTEAFVSSFPGVNSPCVFCMSFREYRISNCSILYHLEGIVELPAASPRAVG